MTSDMEHVQCLYWSSCIFLSEVSVQIFAHLLLGCMFSKFFRYSEHKSLVRYMVLQIFSTNQLPFYFLTEAFKEKLFQTLMKSNLSIFSSVAHAYSVILKKSWVKPRMQRFFSWFCPEFLWF